MKSHKSYTAHEANKMLNRKGQFWMQEYFDRYIRDDAHFRNTVRYIENNSEGRSMQETEWLAI